MSSLCKKNELYKSWLIREDIYIPFLASDEENNVAEKSDIVIVSSRANESGGAICK